MKGILEGDSHVKVTSLSKDTLMDIMCGGCRGLFIEYFTVPGTCDLLCAVWPWREPGLTAVIRRVA